MYLNNMHPNKLLSASVLVTNGVQCGSAFPRPGFPAGQNTCTQVHRCSQPTEIWLYSVQCWTRETTLICTVCTKPPRVIWSIVQVALIYKPRSQLRA